MAFKFLQTQTPEGPFLTATAWNKCKTHSNGWNNMKIWKTCLFVTLHTSRMKYSIGRAYLHLFSHFKNCNKIWPKVSENILCPHLLSFCLLIVLSIHLLTCRSHLCLYPFFSLSILTFINPWYKLRQGVSLMFEFFPTSVIHNRTEKKINWNPGCVPGILIKISSFNSISSLKFLLLPFFKSRQTAFLLWPNSNDN